MLLSNNNNANNQVSSNSTVNNPFCCAVCGKNLINNPDDGLIMLKNNKQQITEDVVLVCRGTCDDTADASFRRQGYRIGTKEMNNGFRELYIKSHFTPSALRKYESILAKL